MTNLLTRSGVVVLTFVTFLAGCGRGDSEDDAAHVARATVAGESVLLVAQPFTEFIDGIGSVVPRPGESAMLGAPTAARILRVLVVAGQHVTAGEALVELDRTSIDAVARSAEATLAAAEAAAARATRLVDAGVAPRREAEQATADMARARADAATARHSSELATLRAPLSGVIMRVTATVGELADPGRSLVEIANPAAIDVLLTLPAADAAPLRPGMTVVMRAGGDSVGHGTVIEVGGAVDSLTRGVGVRVRVAATTRTLRLGETLHGSITAATDPHAITVPIAALVPAGESFRVFVVDSLGVVHARPVTVAGRDASRAHIIAGLTAGERIVTVGAYGMDEGARLSPTEARP